VGLNLTSLWNLSKPHDPHVTEVVIEPQERVNASLDVAKDYIEV
jgi:hypothetical protein